MGSCTASALPLWTGTWRGLPQVPALRLSRRDTHDEGCCRSSSVHPLWFQYFHFKRERIFRL